MTTSKRDSRRNCPNKGPYENGKQEEGGTLLNRNKHRSETIGNQNGLKAPEILGLNPDNLITTERQNDLRYELQKNRIHIGGIEETHIPLEIETARGSYKITTSAATSAESRNKQKLA